MPGPSVTAKILAAITARAKFATDVRLRSPADCANRRRPKRPSGSADGMASPAAGGINAGLVSKHHHHGGQAGLEVGPLMYHSASWRADVSRLNFSIARRRLNWPMSGR